MIAGGAPGWLRRHAEFYRVSTAVELKTALQYRWPTLLGMVALMCEPVVYLAVWTSVARANGGSVGGLTLGQVSAYYVVWTVARNLVAGVSPEVWQARFREGLLAEMLLRPIHPVHNDLAGGLGGNVPRMVMTVPITVVLVLVFRP
ncbi:MAG TPA: hypothetical protein PLV68_19740, partial [Ilumatobacteraceae bacterium]|nr:hypothetical protein [Ilumatobacteraceae bacterium]